LPDEIFVVVETYLLNGRRGEEECEHSLTTATNAINKTNARVIREDELTDRSKAIILCLGVEVVLNKVWVIDIFMIKIISRNESVVRIIILVPLISRFGVRATKYANITNNPPT
jgi:hypothetical protein